MIRVVVERVVMVDPWRTRIIEERSLEDGEEASRHRSALTGEKTI